MVVLEVISLVLLLIVLAEAGAIMIGGKWFWRILKCKLLKGKGYVWMLKFYRDGTVDIEFERQKESVKFGEGDETQIVNIYHYERDSGVPLHVIVQGKSYNINMLKEYEPETTSKMINQAMIRAHQQGILEGMRAALKQISSDPKLIVLLVLVLLAAGAAGYFGYQIYTLLTKKGLMCKLAGGGSVLIKGG